MRCKRVCLVVNPRAGYNITHITDILAIFAAAGWKTDIALKTYGGEVMKLAAEAAEQGHDRVIAYGGDGTLNKVVNGVMLAKKQSAFAALPGGTANEWATEISLPLDPVHAALSIVNSDARTIDLGHVEVQRLMFPDAQGEDDQRLPKSKKTYKKGTKGSSKAKHRFLLMAGLGIDAQILPYISKSLKYQIGRRAFEAAAARRLPELRSFPAEIYAINDAGDESLLWRGTAWQLLIANTRLYGSMVDVAPEAYLDDGKLDVCVITTGDLFATIGQITSLLLRHRPDETTVQYFQGAHFAIRVPASVGMHLDGSFVKLRDYLSKSDREALRQADNADQVMVEYRFDVEPHTLQVAIPRTYDNALFEKSIGKEQPYTVSQQQANAVTTQQYVHFLTLDTRELPERVNKLWEHGRRVTLVGVAPNPERRDTYIIAGTVQSQKTGDIAPVAVCIDDATVILTLAGESVPPATLQGLPEGKVIGVEGKKNKLGVIQATHVVF